MIEKTKSVTFSLTSTDVDKLKIIAKRILGKPNKSGMISFWINQEFTKNNNNTEQ